MKTIRIIILIAIIALSLQACAMTPGRSQDQFTTEDESAVGGLEGADTVLVPPVRNLNPNCVIPANQRLETRDLEYQGAFRLPDASGGSNWEYSGQGLTYYPSGNPDGAEDGFPGSLFGIGHDQQMQVSEISIPAPVISRNLDDLNTALTLQPFSDITRGIFNLETMDLPVADLAFLPSLNAGESGKLHFVFGQHFQNFDPSQGWIGLDLSDPGALGPWKLNGFTNYATSDYLFDIPENWVNAVAPGQLLATGRFREGVWGGGGPALFAYNPGDSENPLASGAALSEITPLLLYGFQAASMPEIQTDETMQMNGYQLSDHWTGGAWLSVGEKSAVIFVGTKALGHSWYGFGNGLVWEYDCAEQQPPSCPEPPEWPYDNRGYWAEDYQGQIIFFDPSELAGVGCGQLETWEPQPYATLLLDEFLYSPELNPADYKRDLVGAATFDREHDLLYVLERLADGYKSVVHVWRVNP